MNRDLEPRQPPVILEGEILAPRPHADHEQAHAQPKVHVIKIGWIGKAITMLVLLTIFAAAIVLAAGALLIMIPVAVMGAIWGWLRIRKRQN